MTKTYSVKDPEAGLRWCRLVRVGAMEDLLMSQQFDFENLVELCL